MLLSIKTFLEGHCPLLDGKILSLHFLGEQAGALGLFATGSSKTLKKFTDGGALFSYEFIICLRTAFDADEKDAESSINFLEGISNFLEQAEENGLCPALSAEEVFRGFVIKARPFLVSNNTKTAKLQMQCSLLYEKKGCKH